MGKFVGAGDSFEAFLFDYGVEVDPESSGGAATCGDVAALGPVVDDIGFDTEVVGGLGDAYFVVVSSFWVDGVVLVG